MLTIAVLGAVEVRRDGRLVTVPAGKSTEVLVRLALDAGEPVRAETIIEDLWADQAFTTARNTLQSKISQLRRALGDPALITGSRDGYTLHIGADDIDARRVAGLPARVAALRHAGDDAGAVALAGEGVALFRGELRAGDGDWLRPHRARLDEIRIGLLEEQLAARVELGFGGAAVGELESLVVSYPLRESLWHTLILALYRTGRQADALAAYGRARATFVDELGLDPGPALQSLERRILRHDRDLRVVVQESSPLTIGNLPRLSSPIVGRAADLAAVGRRLADERLVTIVGPAGVGKTRLAIEAARGIDKPGGTWFIRLDAADLTTSLAGMIADALSLTSEDLLVQRVAAADTLLVLDNCEHVADPAATLAEQLLDATTGLRVLATSQVPLGIDGESVYTLAPLPVADSLRLFVNRATEVRTQFTLDNDTRRVVEDVCLALDGLPLAIELAAARVKSLSVREIARRLDNRFVLLADPGSRRPERRRALVAALEWSYELLFPDDQRGLWALSCFVGGARLDAAERVLAALGVPETAALDVIGRLVDRSLVNADIDARGDVRYRMLDSIRAFAQDKLRAAGLHSDAYRAHALWFAAAADRTAATVRGRAQAQCLAFVRDERVDIDAALAWSATHDPLTGVRIANGFGWAWVVLGDGTAGARRVRTAHLAAELVPERDRLAGLLLSGWLEASAGDVEYAESELQTALDLADRIGEPSERANVQRHLVFLRLMQGRPQDALHQASESLRTYRELALDWEQAASLLLGASASMMLGNIADATNWADEAVDVLTPIGDSWGLVHAEAMLGAIAQAAHRYDAAARYLGHAAAASEELGFLGQAAYHLTRLGRVHQQSGDNAAAASTLHRAIDAAVGCGDMRMAAGARLNLARVQRATGDLDAATTSLRQIDDWYRSAGGGDGALITQVLFAALGDPESDATTAQLDNLLAEARSRPDQEAQILTLDALAHIHAARGNLDNARRLLAAADQLLPQAPAVDEIDRIDAHAARRLVRADQPANVPTITPGGR